jgi:hypothetical protein
MNPHPHFFLDPHPHFFDADPQHLFIGALFKETYFIKIHVLLGCMGTIKMEREKIYLSST